MTSTIPREVHLRDDDFFRLVLPPAAAPEELPAHLASCPACERQFAQWRVAAEGLAAGPAGPPEDFESRVMEKVRAMGVPRRHRPIRLWAIRLAAAACLLAAFWLGTRVASRPVAASLPDRTASMSDADRADDDLLRDVSRLVSSEDDTNWRSLAPLPPVSEENS